MNASSKLDSSVDVTDLDSVVEWAILRFGRGLRVATSLGIEDMIVLDAIDRVARRLGTWPRAFLLDTGRLHEETLEFLDFALSRYSVPIDVFVPDALEVESLLREQGPFGFRASIESRKRCCEVRKIHPLKRALAEASAWMTGLRRAQSPTRAEIAVVEQDLVHGLVKLNPLAHWGDEDVRQRSEARRLRLHPLHARGFPSIGCAPCTRAVAPGDDPRAGRWWWESPEHKECGLHPLRAQAPAPGSEP